MSILLELKRYCHHLDEEYCITENLCGLTKGIMAVVGIMCSLFGGIFTVHALVCSNPEHTCSLVAGLIMLTVGIVCLLILFFAGFLNFIRDHSD